MVYQYFQYVYADLPLDVRDKNQKSYVEHDYRVTIGLGNGRLGNGRLG